MPYTYEDIPLPPSRVGAARYATGRRLVGEHGVRLDEVVWDADEVLWDWVMDAGRMLRGAAKSLWNRDVGHREYYLVKPGVFELIWGMHHAALEAGEDPWMRVWTNGYPWRLWRIAREIPGFVELLGAPATTDASGRQGFAEHPRIFYRGDFEVALDRLLESSGGLDGLEALQDLSGPVRRTLERQLRDDPCDTSFKLPELAPMAGKDGFEQARFLVDDRARNVRRFADSGRFGVHVISRTPRTCLGTVPNTVWRSPYRALRRLANDVAGAIADGLSRVRRHRAPAAWSARPTARDPEYPELTFEFDVPDARLRREWIAPRVRLEARYGRRADFY